MTWLLFLVHAIDLRAVAVAASGALREPAAQACSDRLAGRASLSASSALPEHDAQMAVMDGVADHAWTPEASTKHEWLQYTFDSPMEVHFLQTSAPADADVNGGVEQYKLQYSQDGASWEWYVSGKGVDEGAGWTVLDAFAEAPNAKMVELDPPITASYVRIWPTEWRGKIALRAAVRGCDAGDVMAAQLELNATFGGLFPGTFDGENDLREQLRVHVASAIGVPPDMIQVMKVAASATDPSKTAVELHVLPKAGAVEPAKALEALGAVVQDPQSGLYQWLQKAEKTSDHKHRTCIDVQCGPHGQCAGGECFCFDGWAGALCSTSTRGDASPWDPAPSQHTLSGSPEVLPVLTSAPLLPPSPKKCAPRPSDDEVRSSLDEIVMETQEEMSEYRTEGGLSGKVKEHKVLLLPAVGALVVALLGLAAYLTPSKGREGSPAEDAPAAEATEDQTEEQQDL